MAFNTHNYDVNQTANTTHKTPQSRKSSSQESPMMHHSWMRGIPQNPSPTFKAYRQFNQAELSHHAGRRERDFNLIPVLFNRDHIADEIARVLGAARAVNLKEIIESFEFFQRIRKRVRRPVVADFCCGHGLVGILFALLERSVEEVYLLDLAFPKAQARMIEALSSKWPWIESKLRYCKRDVKGSGLILPKKSGIIAVHACGARTDWAIDAAIEVGGPIAVMPCCYAKRAQTKARPPIERHLGVQLGVDIERTYQLEALGYEVVWQFIPNIITPMNRIIAASPHA